MEKRVVRTEAAPAPFQGAPYNQAIVAGDLVFTAGQLGLKPGDTAVVKLYFSKAASYSSKWYLYDAIADRWYDFSAYAKFAGDRKSVTLTLKDGGPGDADGVANGVIVN